MVLLTMRELTEDQPTIRAAYSPREFAAKCGKHPTWAYRLLYDGKIQAVTQLGRILIPAAELSRVLAAAEPYNPQGKSKSATAESGGEE
jgi:hypothetical protein